MVIVIFIGYLPGESNLETDERDKFVGVVCLYILHYHLFHVVDKKTFKLLWELHKKVRVNFFAFLVVLSFTNLYYQFTQVCSVNVKHDMLTIIASKETESV